MGNQTSSVEVLQVTSKMKGLFALVFAMTLAVAQSGTVTNVGAHRPDSIKQGEAGGNIIVWFTPTTEVDAGGTITMTASATVFTNGATPTTACTSDGTALASACTTATTTTVATVTLAGGTKLLAGKPASVTFSSTLVANNPASAVTFAVKTSTDTTAATAVGWGGITAFTPQDFTADRTTLKGTVAGGDLTFGFTPVTKIAAGGTIILTSTQQIWTANEDSSAGGTTACTATQVNPATGLHAAVAVTKTVITGTTGKIATLTMTPILYAGLPVTVTCDGTKNLAVNGADAQAYAMQIATSTDGTATGSATKYTANKGVAWTSATRTTYTTGVAGGNLVFTFTPKTTVANNGIVTLTASESIFTADAAVTCTATSDGTAATVTSAASTSTAAVLNTGTAAMKNILKVTMGADLTLAKVAVITCTTNLANNGATAGAVTFTIETSTDTGKLGKQTGYTLAAPAASSSAAAAGNSTAASASGTATGTETTVTQVYTFASLTVAAYTGKMKSNCECAYANTVGGATTPLWCTATTSAYNYVSGVTMSSTVAARRANAKVTFTLAVKSSVKSTAQLQTLVASGSTNTAFQAALTAVNTASNYTATPGTATVATATFTGGTSSASTLLPSMLSLVAAIFVAARQ